MTKILKRFALILCLLIPAILYADTFPQKERPVISAKLKPAIPYADTFPLGKDDQTKQYWQTATVQDVKNKIANGANVNAHGIYDNTPLMYASGFNENPEIVSILIAARANVNAQSQHGTTPLMWASRFNENPEIITTLITARANVNARDNEGRTPLMWASGFNVIKMLVVRKFSVNAHDEDGTPLMWTGNKNLESITGLMRGVQITVDLKRNKNPEIITTLIAAGANVNARDKGGITSLMAASLFIENPKVITALIAAGANVNARNVYGDTPLMWASRYNKNPEIIKTLIAAGADVSLKNKDGETAYNHISGNEYLRDSEAYWLLNDLRFK